MEEENGRSFRGTRDCEGSKLALSASLLRYFDLTTDSLSPILSRERNKMHARKTRERKKLQTVALQNRVTELQEEVNNIFRWYWNEMFLTSQLSICAQGLRLRQMVDERYTASVLLGMSCQTYQDLSGEPIALKSSHMICNNAYATAMADNNWFGENGSSPSGQKRIRRRGKYSPQERERIR